MSTYQYKTVAAPRKLKRVKGVKGPNALAAHAVEAAISAEAADGWEYVRTDRFPVEEKSSMFSRPVVTERAVMIFRKAIAAAQPMAPQPAAPQPVAEQPAPPPRAEPAPPQPAAQPAPPQPQPQQPQPAAQPPQPAAQPPRSEPGFSVAGVEPAPRTPPIGGAND